MADPVTQGAMVDPLKRTAGGPRPECLSGDASWTCSKGCTCWKYERAMACIRAKERSE